MDVLLLGAGPPAWPISSSSTNQDLPTRPTACAISSLRPGRARAAWRLVPLLLPYLLLFGIVATIWQNQPERPLTDAGLSAWTQLHIGLAVIAQRSGNRNEHRSHFGNSRKIGARAEPSRVDLFRNLPGGNVLDITLAGVQRVRLFWIDIEAEDTFHAN